MVPFYSIESWLLQATSTARKLCASHPNAHETLERLAEWERDRGLLDEVVKPKEATCLRDKHNAALADGLTRREVEAMRAADKSFAAFVTALEGAHDLSGYLGRLAH
jgi:hypothetical protein